MKTKLIKLALLVSLFAPSIAFAQTSTVPKLMSYQGRVTDAAGVLIGNTSPVNRTVTFRFYSDPSAGAAVYAEQQTVTISGGEFSVLIGNGTGVVGSPGPSTPAAPTTTLDAVVNASVNPLYLGITVDDGNSGTVDAEIAPRQQLVTGAYAMRSSMAEAVVSGAITSDMIRANTITSSNIAAGSIGGDRLSSSGIVAGNIANSAITASKLDTATIGLWTPSGNHVYRNNNVGIGESNPGVPLSFGNVLGEKIALYGSNSNTKFGFGIQNSLLQIYTSANSQDVAFGHGNSAAMTETMRIKGNGNVGIGTSTPTAKLDIGGSVKLNGTAGRNIFKDAEKSDGSGLRVGAVWNMYGIYAETGAGALGGVDGVRLQNDKVAVTAAGNVGIGTTVPSQKLSIHDGKLWFTSGGADTGGIGGTMAGNDFFRIYGFGGNNDGALYIDTYDDANEPIVFRQVAGAPDAPANTFYERMRISSSGNVGIGTSTPNDKLDVNGAIRATGSHNGSVAVGRLLYADNGVVIDVYNSYHNSNWRRALFNGDSNWDFSSDARLKKNIQDAEPVLDRLLQVPLRRFQWHDDADTAELQFGVIAQEILPLFPDIVSETRLTGHTEDTYMVGYTTFGTLAVKAIQELKARNDDEVAALYREIEHLADAVDEKDARIADLETRLAALERLVSSAR